MILKLVESKRISVLVFGEETEEVNRNQREVILGLAEMVRVVKQNDKEQALLSFNSSTFSKRKEDTKKSLEVCGRMVAGQI